MPIVFGCPSCGCNQRAGEHLIGRTLRCQDCGKSFVVPAESSATMPAPVAPAAAAAPSPHFTPPAPEQPQDDDDIFFDQIRKGGSKKRKR